MQKECRMMHRDERETTAAAIVNEKQVSINIDNRSMASTTQTEDVNYIMDSLCIVEEKG